MVGGNSLKNDQVGLAEWVGLGSFPEGWEGGSGVGSKKPGLEQG